MNKKDEHIEPEPETVLPNGKLRMPLRNPNFTEEEKEKRNSIAKRAMNSIIGDLSNAKESKVGHSFDGSCGCVKCLQFKKQFVKPLDQEYLRGMFALFAEKVMLLILGKIRCLGHVRMVILGKRKGCIRISPKAVLFSGPMEIYFVQNANVLLIQ